MIRTLLAAALAGLLLAACDGETDESASSKSDRPGGAVFGTGFGVTIEAHDLYFEPKELQVPAGTVDVTYVNQGAIYHTLTVDGVEGLTLEVNTKGDEDQGSIELKPGKYTFYCDVPGHRAAGMETRVTAQ